MASKTEEPSLEANTAGPEDEKKNLSKKAAKTSNESGEVEAATAALTSLEVDPLSANYDLRSKAVTGSKWTEIQHLNVELEGKRVLIRGQAQAIRAVGKDMAFFVLRHKVVTVQCVVTVTPELVSRQMVKFSAGLSRESVVDVEGIISVPGIGYLRIKGESVLGTLAAKPQNK